MIRDDALSLIRKIINELKLDPKVYKPKSILNQISGAKNNLIGYVEYATSYVTDTHTQVAAKVYEHYTKRLFKANCMDFDDLIVKPIELF